MIRSWRPVPRRRMRTYAVVMNPPVLDQNLGLSERVEDLPIGPGNLVAIERAGIESEEFANELFGDIDVPALETHPSPIEPYDPSRSLQLNLKHPVAAALFGFPGSKLEEARAGLVRRPRDARKTEKARRLAVEVTKLPKSLTLIRVPWQAE